MPDVLSFHTFQTLSGVCLNSEGPAAKASVSFVDEVGELGEEQPHLESGLPMRSQSSAL